MTRINDQIAGRLEEAARLLRDQGADAYRVTAYVRAAASVRSTARPSNQIFRERGLDGLRELPRVGETIARAIRELLVHGRLPMLDRLPRRGETRSPARVGARHRPLSSLNGCTTTSASRHWPISRPLHTTGASTAIAGFGANVWPASGIHSPIGSGAVRISTSAETPSRVRELLDVDREYREKAAADQLRASPTPLQSDARGVAPDPAHTARSTPLYGIVLEHGAGAPRRQDSRLGCALWRQRIRRKPAHGHHGRLWTAARSPCGRRTRR
jgi:hypothetical protein